jgi:Putative prokaryotic signal transducing protein
VRWRLGGTRGEGQAAQAPGPVMLCIAETEAEASMMRGLLAENGITVAVAPSGGPDLRGMYAAGGRCVLLVRPEDADEARALVASHFS